MSDSLQQEQSRTDTILGLTKPAFWLLITSVIVFLSLPFWFPIRGHDAWIHLNWLEQYPKAQIEFNGTPLWLEQSNWGFGSPAFVFYPSGVYDIATEFYIHGLNDSESLFKVIGILATILSCLVAYLSFNLIVAARKAAIVGALMYACNPLMFLILYTRNALTEYFALALLPLLVVVLFLSSGNLKLHKKYKWPQWSATILLGLLLLTVSFNIPVSAIILSVILLVVCSKFIKWTTRLWLGVCIIVVAGLNYLANSEVMPLISSIQTDHLWDIDDRKGTTGNSFIDIFNGNTTVFDFSIIVIITFNVFLFFRSYKLMNEESEFHDFLRMLKYIVLTVVLLQIPGLSNLVFSILPLKFVQFSWRFIVLLVLITSFCITLSFIKQPRFISRYVSACALLLLPLVIAAKLTTGNGPSYDYISTGRLDPPEYLSTSALKDPEEAYAAFSRHKNDSLVEFSSLEVTDSIKLWERKTPCWYEFRKNTVSPGVAVFHIQYSPLWVCRDSGAYKTFADSLGRLCALVPPGIGKFQLHLSPYSLKQDVPSILVIFFISLTLVRIQSRLKAFRKT